MLKTIKQMLEEFEKKNIRYCHWKSNEHLDLALNGDTDLDVLFDFSQRELLDEVLSKLSIKRFRATPLMQYNGIEDFIGFDYETAKIWHLHAHYRMTLGEKHLKGYTITPWLEIILSNRIKIDNIIYTSSFEDELVLLLCRIALKIRYRDLNKKIGNDDIKEIKWLINRIDRYKLKESASKLTNNEIARIIMNMTQTKLIMKKQFIKLQKKLRKEFKLYSSYNKVTSYLTRTKREIFWLIGGLKRRLGFANYKANRRISPAGGLVVAFLGCDGAGKSTTISYLKKEFNKKIDVATIYFGSGDGSSSLIRKPMKLFAKRVSGKGLGHRVEEEYKNQKKVSLKSKIYSFAKIIWAVTLANEKKKKLRKMTKARNNGLLVITDRYPQTIFPGCSDGPLLSRYKNKGGLLQKISDWENHIYELASINPPDLTVKLMVPTDIAIERKPEMTKEEINQKKEIVEKLDFSKHSIIIDTSKDFKITSADIMEEIWKLI